MPNEVKGLSVVCYRENRVSNKSGKIYQVLIVVFPNGYRFESFLNNDQQFLLQEAPIFNA